MGRSFEVSQIVPRVEALEATSPAFFAASSYMKLATPAPSDPDWAYSEFPAVQDSNFCALIGVGPVPSGPTVFNRTTVLGALIGQSAVDWDRSEAIGQGAGRWARWMNRNTLMGSLTAQWLGRTQAELMALHHDMYDPIVNFGLVPGDVGWDWLGLETANPGIGAKIAAATPASSPDDIRGNALFARDAGCEMINGMFNTALGYKAMSSAFVVQNQTAVGKDAMLMRVFGTTSAAFGYAAGRNAQEGDRCLFNGAWSGQDLIVGNRNSFLTPYAGSTTGGLWSHVNDVILMGSNAGEGIASYDAAFLIHNGTAPRPLMQGNLKDGVIYGMAMGTSSQTTQASVSATAETKIAGDVVIQARTIGLNGWMDVRGKLKLTGAGDKIVRVRMGGISGDIIAEFHVGDGMTQASFHTRLRALGSQAAQEAETFIWGLDGSGAGMSYNAVDSIAAVMSSARTLSVTVEQADGTTQVTSYSVETTWMP